MLKEKIFGQQPVPGERLKSLEFEKRLGINRTPLKNAIATASLPVIEPGQGMSATTPTCERIAASFDMRRVLEVYAVPLAAKIKTREDLNRIRAGV